MDIIYALSTASSICKYGKTKINNEREKTREKSYTIWINIESYSSRALLMMLLLLYQAEVHILSILTDISTLYSLWKSNIIPFYLLIAVVIAISFHHLMDEHQWVYSACTRTFVLLLLNFQCIFFVFVCVCVSVREADLSAVFVVGSSFKIHRKYSNYEFDRLLFIFDTFESFSTAIHPAYKFNIIPILFIHPVVDAAV